jgi:hypothetical protein
VTADPSGVPCFSQWESPELAGRFLDGSLRDAPVRLAGFARFAAGRGIVLPG